MTSAKHSRSISPETLIVRSLPRRSLFYRAGVRPRDRILAVNGERVRDELDFRFHIADHSLHIDLLRNGVSRTIVAARGYNSFPEIEFVQKPVTRCANRCIFCFIDQMPPGLRAPLYIKDEDLSHSFLNGNYVTLTNARERALRRIVSLGLSPLFISVHATDPAVRGRMLGIRRAPPIMDQLRFLRDNGIGFHTQIVVCPGYNDGAVLGRTADDLFSLGESLLSIAVVPVGLTRFRRVPLQGVDSGNARRIVGLTQTLNDADLRRRVKLAGRGLTRRLFCADELFLRAGLPIPPRAYYGDYPQIGNGVGLLRQLLEEWNIFKRSHRRVPDRGKKYFLVTSVSAQPFLAKIARETGRLWPHISITVAAVENDFFGHSVTVAGLLTGRDVLKAIRKEDGRFDAAFLPRVMFNHAGFTLDGYSAKRIARSAPMPVRIVSSPVELARY